MRELPVTLALSLLVHAAAAAWYVTTDHPEQTRAVTAPAAPVALPAPPTARVDDVPVEVALLDDDTVTHVPALAPGSLATHDTMAPPRPRSQAIATTAPSTTELPPRDPTPPTPPTKKPSLLSMRDGRPEPIIHRPGSDGISDDALAKMVRGELPVTIANLPGARETASFERADDRLRDPHWVEGASPDELAAARGERLAAREAQRAVELVAQKDGTYTSEKTTFRATVNRDGTIDLHDKPNWQRKSLLSAEFDVTDAFMRSRGIDPYASAKREFLDRTREQRYEIGKRYRTEQLAESARLMAANLAQLWASTSDPRKRKDELFALWDECAETGDPELVAGGAAARQLVINWIHAKHVELTPAEVAAFNARKKSKVTFSL